MSSAEQNFDRDWPLAELLDARDLAQLGGALSTLLDGPCAIEDEAGTRLWGPAIPDARRCALTLELEPIGYLCVAQATPAELDAARSLLLSLLRARLSLRMAGSLHQAAMAEDYLSLRTEHARLQASETRYRDLAAQLEDKVKAQLAELEARQQQLFMAARLASVGQLAAGVAHEINNPLGFVRSNLRTLSAYIDRISSLKPSTGPAGASWQQLDMDFVISDSNEILAECTSGLDRIATIVRDLKDFSNVDQAEFGRYDLNLGLQQAARQLEGQRPPNVTLDLALQTLPAINGLCGQLNQVFLSVLRNAIQAIESAQRPGTVQITSAHDSQRILIRIQDDGIGMDAQTLQRAFDPFFTTRRVGEGMGLGLSAARSILSAHGASISLTSAPGSGTVVSIEFPLGEAPQ